MPSHLNVRRGLLALIACFGLAFTPSQADQLVQGGGSASAIFGTSEQISVVVDRDFSGTYGTGTYTADGVQGALYFDCVVVTPGASPEQGTIVASGTFVGGLPIPWLRGFTVKISTTGAGTTAGIVDGLHVSTAPCGSGSVPMRAATTGFVTFGAP